MQANPHVDLTRKIRILWRPELYSIQQNIICQNISRCPAQEKVTCTLSCDQTRDSYLTLFHILSEAFLDIQDLLLIAPTPHNVALSTTKHSID